MIYSLLRLLVGVLAIALFLKVAIKLVFQVDISYFNPFKLKFVKLVIHEDISFNSLQYNPFKHKIILSGVSIKTHNRKVQDEQQKSNPNQLYVKLPKFIYNRVDTILNILDGLTISLDEVSLQTEHMSIGNIDMDIIYSAKTKKLETELFIRKLTWKDNIIASDLIVNLDSTLNFDGQKTTVYPQNITMDFKSSNINIPAKLLKPQFIMKKESTKEIKEMAETSCEETIDRFHEFLTKSRYRASAVHEISVAIDKFSLTEIGVAHAPKLQELNEFLNYNISANSILFNMTRFYNDMPGYRLNYRPQDRPFKVNAAINTADLIVNMKEKGSSHLQKLKVAEIPSLALHGSTNVFSQHFDLHNKDSLQNVNSTIKCQISSPVLDVDITKLSFIKCFFRNIKVFQDACRSSHDTASTTENKFYRAKRILLIYSKTLLPLVDFRLAIEDLRLIFSDHDDVLMLRNSLATLIYKSKCSVSTTETKNTDTAYGLELQTKLSDLQVQHLSQDTNYKHRLLQIETISLKTMFDILPEALVSVRGSLDTLNFDLSELATMIMLNNLIRKQDCQILTVEQGYFKELYERFATQITKAEDRCSLIQEANDRPTISPKEILFKSLPSYVDYIKLDITNIAVTVGSRSVLMPAKNFSSMDPQSPKDLINGKLRKFCNELDLLQVSLFGNRTQWHTKLGTDQSIMVQSAHAASDYDAYSGDGLDDISSSEATEVEHLWNLNFVLSQIKSTVIYESSSSPNHLTSRSVSKISGLSVKVYPDMESYAGDSDYKLMVKVENKSITSILCLMNIFLVISGIHTIKQIFGRDVCSFRHSSWAKKYFVALGSHKRKGFFSYVNWAELQSLVEVDFVVEFITLLISFPNGLKSKFDIVNTFINVTGLSEATISGEYFRMCVQSPMFANAWTRMLTITHFSAQADINEVKKQLSSEIDDYDNLSPSILLENESAHIMIPYDFKMFRLFDNFSTVFKSIKQLVYSLKTSKNDLIIMPHPIKPPKIPKVKLKSKRLLLSLEDDPFEAELNMIFQIGLEEQKSRLSKLDAFETMIATKADGNKAAKSKKKSGYVDAFSHKMCTLKRRITKFAKKDIHLDPKKQNLSTISNSIKDFTHRQASFKKDDRKESKSETRYEEARREEPDEEGQKGQEREEEKITESLVDTHIKEFTVLQENISKSWIDRVHAYKRKEQDEFKKNFTYLWGSIDFKHLPENFNEKVLNFSSTPYLTNIILEGIDINLFKPSCGIEGLPDFIHDVGKGVPRDTEYSIMIPLFLDARFDEIRWHLKDYPLPMVHIPSLHKSQTRIKESMRLHGNFLITEDLIKSQHELRTVFVPLIPSIKVINQDKFYSLLVPRTLTSIKIYTNLQWDINSCKTTQVTWGGSYSSAVQQTMQCLDNFSKPPIDPSLKLGFWDKIGYLFHARIIINWPHDGKFEIALKGAKNPYMLGGRAAGFIIGFNGNTRLTCNPNDDPQNFLSCSADEVHFSIPNHFAKPLLVWDRPSGNSVFVPSQTETHLQQLASYYYLIQLENKPNEEDNMRKMYESYIEKTGIKLSGGMSLTLGIIFERLLENCQRTSKFRPHNEVRLCNPIYVDNLSNYDSYAGFRSDVLHLAFILLSNSDTSSNSMQLSPVSVQVFLEWWKTFSGNMSVRRGKLYGEETSSPKFGDALHSISYRAEVSPLFISHVHHSIDTNHNVKNKYMEVAEFAGLKAQTYDFVMDLHQRKEVISQFRHKLNVTQRVRTMKFLEADISATGIDIRTLYGKFKQAMYVEEKEDAKIDIFDNDMTWYDITDFKEAYFIDPHTYIPEIYIRPLLYAPLFHYRKRASYGDKFQVNFKDGSPVPPIENQISHNCTLGRKPKLPLDPVEKRLDLLKQSKISKSETSQKNGTEMFELTNAKMAIKKVEFLLEDLKKLASKPPESLNESDFHYPLSYTLSRTKSKIQDFQNIFFIFNMQLKWNEGARNVFYKYLLFLELSYQFSTLRAQKALRTFEEIIKQKLSGTNPDEENLDTDVGKTKCDLDYELSKSEHDVEKALLNLFEEGINSILCPVDYVPRQDHIVQFTTPQIQLMTENEPGACLIVTAPSITLKVNQFCDKRSDDLLGGGEFLKRYALLFANTNVFLVHRDDYKGYFDLFFARSSYGQQSGAEWPPWLGIELCLDPQPLEQAALVKNLSTVLYYDRVHEFSSLYDTIKDRLPNKMKAYLPKVIVTSDSRSYLSMYRIVTNLLMYIEPENADLQKRIERLRIGYTSEDITTAHQTAIDLQRNINVLTLLENELLFKQKVLDDVDKADLISIHNEKMNTLLKLYILIKVSCSGGKKESNTERTMYWNAIIKEVILHMLDENRQPFVDVAAANIHFERIVSSSGYNKNTMMVKVAQVFNLGKNVLYHNLLEPLNPPTGNEDYDNFSNPLVKISWVMNKPVGGIKVLKEVKTNLSGLNINLEEETIHKILAWLLPHEVNSALTKRNSTDSDNSSKVSDAESLASSSDFISRDNPELNEMIQRSTDYLIIEDMAVNGFELCISFKGKGTKRLVNVTDFMFVFPSLAFKNQTMRVIDLLLIIKKVLLKALMRQSGKFLMTKITKKSSNDQNHLVGGAPLKQLTDYEAYTDIRQLYTQE